MLTQQNLKISIYVNDSVYAVTSQNYNEYYDCEYRADDIVYTNGDATYDNFRYLKLKLFSIQLILRKHQQLKTSGQ